MAQAFPNSVRFLVTNPGTSTFTVGSTPAGFFPLTDVTDGDVVYYSASDAAGGREDGYGTVGGTGTTLTRTVVRSTNANAAVNFTGVTDVVITVLGSWFSTRNAALSYVEFTSPVTITSTNSAAPNNIVSSAAVTVDGSTLICVEFWCPGSYLRSGGANPTLSLWDGSTELGTAELYLPNTAGEFPCSLKRYLTPSSGSHTYHIKAWDSVGSPGPIFQVGAGGVATYLPGYVLVKPAY